MPEWLAGPIEQIVDAFLSEYGPVFAVLVGGIIFLFIKYDRSKTQLIQAKDAEIERLVNERNKYQDMFLGTRLSSLREDE